MEFTSMIFSNGEYALYKVTTTNGKIFQATLNGDNFSTAIPKSATFIRDNGNWIRDADAKIVLDHLIHYIESNYRFVGDALEEREPKL